MQVEISHERHAQIQEYAERRGQNPTDAIDEMLADALEWERVDSLETIQAVREAYESVKAGTTRPVSEFLDELRQKHDF